MSTGNVLPKTAWYTSYSDRVTSEMNQSFLKQLHKIWLKHGLPEDTSNLDFTTIPYWGDDQHPENNRSGKRGKALHILNIRLCVYCENLCLIKFFLV